MPQSPPVREYVSKLTFKVSVVHSLEYRENGHELWESITSTQREFGGEVLPIAGEMQKELSDAARELIMRDFTDLK